jgi:hypothetical protein
MKSTVYGSEVLALRDLLGQMQELERQNKKALRSLAGVAGAADWEGGEEK